MMDVLTAENVNSFFYFQLIHYVDIMRTVRCMNWEWEQWEKCFAMQDNTRTDIQCSETVHGNESEVVRQLYAAVQGRGSEVSLRFSL